MPGGNSCSMATCKSNSKIAKKAGEQLIFFSFPDDHRKKEWARLCRRKDKWSPMHKRICSRHFGPDAYEDELEARLMNRQPKKLKKDGERFAKIVLNIVFLLFFCFAAIPSLFLPLAVEGNTELTERGKRMIRKTNKIIAQALVEASESNQGVCDEVNKLNAASDNNISHADTSSSDDETNRWKKRIETLEEENALLKREMERFKDSERILKSDIRDLTEQIKEYGHQFEERVSLALQDVLTPNQVKIALKLQVKARWTQEELSKAFTLRYFSKRAYIYLRQTLHYPLPGLSTLQQWAANINLSNGILDDVLRIMKTVGETKSALFRATVLSYDEMKVPYLYEYNQKDDAIMGPHHYMQVIMARGLFCKWKQPVFIGFDQKATRELLKNVIIYLHKINYNVVSCTSDCGGGNQGLWKTAEITASKSFLEHQITGKPIYFFADAPHLLKLLRNWFLDCGFMLENDVEINKEPIRILIENTRTEINSCYKLTPNHINVETVQRQNVKLAAQLFSNTTSTALRQYLHGDAAQLADFVQLVNNWFDVMNSYALSTSIPTKKPYGIDLQNQNEVLEKMFFTISNMKCIGKKNQQVFQKCILMSIESLRGLFTQMKAEYDVNYILTHRLNQDCLENFFSQVILITYLKNKFSSINLFSNFRLEREEDSTTILLL
jgi:archaellum component FlaC